MAGTEEEPPAAEGSPQTLEGKVAALEAELGACRSRLEREKKLRLKAQAGAAKLRAKVEELTKKLTDCERIPKATSSKEVQTEVTSEWANAGYYYYPDYYNSSDSHNLPKVPPSNDNEGSNSNYIDDYSDVNGTEQDGPEQQDIALHNSEKSEDPLLAEATLAESLRATAEAAVSQTGFIYDESTGLYYDHSTGFYYDSENQLYYDPATGIYYYCDVETGRYQFHSRVDMQSYTTGAAQHSKERKGKKKRKDAEWPRANDHKDLNTPEQKSCSNLNSLSATGELSSPEEEECSNVKKAKVDAGTRETLAAKVSFDPSDSNSLFEKNALCTVTDDSKTQVTEVESEPEEGEITDSEQEEYSTEDEVISEGTINSEDTDSEGELFLKAFTKYS